MYLMREDEELWYIKLDDAVQIDDVASVYEISAVEV